jgi:hypothetical protein
MTRLRAVLDALRESVERFASFDVGPELREVVSALSVLESDEDDSDLAWVVSRISFAVGHPAAKAPPNVSEVKATVTAAIALHKAKRTKYYRIGDSKWEKLVVFCRCPVAGGDMAGDRVILLPDPGTGEYEPADPGDPWAFLAARKVSWPSFEPPLVRLLVSENSAERDASGFVEVSLAQPGNTKMGPDVEFRPET